MTQTRPPLCSIERSLDCLPDVPILTSRGRSLPGVTVDVHAPINNVEFDAPARDHHILMCIRGGPSRLVQKRAGKVFHGELNPGTILLMPAGCDSSWYGSIPAVAKLRIPVELVEAAAYEVGIGRGGRAELMTIFSGRDASVEQYCSILASELERPPHPSQRLMMESLSCAIAAHILRNYDATKPRLSEAPRRLSKQALKRVVSHVEEHMDSLVSLDELATLCGLSSFHFSAAFKKSTGMSPFVYFERLRSSRAQAVVNGEGD